MGKPGFGNFGPPLQGSGWQYVGGDLRYDTWIHPGPLHLPEGAFPYGGMAIIRKLPVQWSPLKPPQARSDISIWLGAQRRAREQAQRLAEQAWQSRLAAREAHRLQQRAERIRQLEQQARRGIERARQQQEQQRPILQAMLHRNKRLNFDMQRWMRETQTAGTVLGTALAGMVPPRFRHHALRRPLYNTASAMPSPELIVMKQVARIVWRTQWAMENFTFQVIQAAQLISSAIGAAGLPIEAALLRTMLQVAGSVSRSATRVASRIGLGAISRFPKSIDHVLMGCRSEAVRITRKLVQQELARGVQISPLEFGNITDAIFKALVRQVRQDGLLPKTIRIAPAGLTRGALPRGQVAIDVWDVSTGIGWDVTTATVREVAKHERYLHQAMPDGTVIRDVRPLVYTRD